MKEQNAENTHSCRNQCRHWVMRKEKGENKKQECKCEPKHGENTDKANRPHIQINLYRIIIFDDPSFDFDQEVSCHLYGHVINDKFRGFNCAEEQKVPVSDLRYGFCFIRYGTHRMQDHLNRLIADNIDAASGLKHDNHLIAILS